jgi:hypothetical protein
MNNFIQTHTEKNDIQRLHVNTNYSNHTTIVFINGVDLFCIKKRKKEKKKKIYL